MFETKEQQRQPRCCNKLGAINSHDLERSSEFTWDNQSVDGNEALILQRGGQ